VLGELVEGWRSVKSFVARHPLIFSLLLTLALFVLIFVVRAALPTYTLSSAADLPPGLKPLSDQEIALSALRSSETLFQVLAALLAACCSRGWAGGARQASTDFRGGGTYIYSLSRSSSVH
jgi:hypothetical protein